MADLTTIGRLTICFEAPHRVRRTLEALALVFGGDHEIAVGRELTKAHEELVIGPINEALGHFPAPIGEFTILIPPKDTSAERTVPLPPVDELRTELGRTAKTAGAGRRAAMKLLAARYGVSPNDLYKLLES